MLRLFDNRPPLESFRIVSTDDAEDFRRAVFARYPSARSFDVLDHERPFAAQAHDCFLRHSAISYAHYNSSVHFDFDASAEVRRRFCLAGSGETRVQGTILQSAPNSACTIPADAPSELKFDPGYQQLVVRFAVEALVHKLSAWTDATPKGALVFSPSIAAGSKDDHSLMRLVFLLALELDLAGTSQTPGLVELEQSMMLSFLLASRHNQRHLLDRAQRDAAPWQVRRAEEFILGHLNETLTVEAIAAATGTSVSSLFQTFRRSLGCSPMVFAKMRRLDRARAELQASDTTTTVTGVALRWGFQNQGHFARDYRQRFGELPSQTLRRSREQ